jgi:hypothetical protein
MKFGTLIPIKGIHPFYLDMSFKMFLKALSGWRVERVGEDDISLTFVIENSGVCLKIVFIKDGEKPIQFCDMTSIETDDGMLPDGRLIAELNISEFESVYSTKLTRTSLPEDQDESLMHYESGDEPGMMVWETFGSIRGVALFRDPELECEE